MRPTPTKPSAQNRSSEPTPIDGTDEPTPVDAPVEPQQANAPEGLQLVPVSEQPEDKGPWEVTDQIELVYREPFALKGDKTVSAKVVFKNKSESDVAGKLVLVFDGASVPGLKLADSQGQFTEENSVSPDGACQAVAGTGRADSREDDDSPERGTV